MSDQETIMIRLGDQYVPTSAYVNNSLANLEERLGKRLKALERPPLGTAVTHNRVSRIEERVAELAGRVGALETPDVRFDSSSSQATRYKAITEEEWRLIEQVLEKAIAWHDAYSKTPSHDYERRRPFLDGDLSNAIRDYRKQADQ